MYYKTEKTNEGIILKIMGSEVDGRVWCVGLREKDKSYRERESDGFYELSELKKI